jgi:prepilin-type N-terminal cleavage/methylation domain-containing protein
MIQKNTKGFTLIEILIVVNIVAILAGLASVLYVEFGNEARCAEVYGVFPRIIRSQGLYATQYNRYYTALDHDAFRVRGVNLSETQYFTYSTFENEFSSFSIKADATDWAAGGWILYNMKGSPQWDSDGVMIKRDWLPESMH